MKSVRLAAAGVLVCGALTGSLVGSAGASASDGADVEFHDGPRVIEPLVAMPERIQSLATQAADLVEQNKTLLAGSYTTTEGAIVVVAGGQQGAVLAAAQFAGALDVVRIEIARITVSSAQALGDELRATDPTLADAITMWGADPQSGGLFISFNRAPSDADRSAIEAFSRLKAIPIFVEVEPGLGVPEAHDSRPTDYSPYRGGNRYSKTSYDGSAIASTNLCTSGFGYAIGTAQYMLTAGHCFARDSAGDYMWIYSGVDDNYDNLGAMEQRAGKYAASTWDNGVGTVRNGADADYHGDLSLVRVDTYGRAAGDHVWWGGKTTTDGIPVKYRRTPTEGWAVCFSGAISGSDCGTTIDRVNISIDYGGGEGVVRNGDRSYSGDDADCSKNGDSGAPVIADHFGAETMVEAVGIISGGNPHRFPSGCYDFMTGVEEAVQAWGGNIKIDY